VSRLHHDLAGGKTWMSPFRNALFISCCWILAFMVVRSCRTTCRTRSEISGH